MSLSTGDRLGPYEIVAPLGAGGMGEVFKARDPRLHRIVAIKILPADVAADPQRRERFRREALAISSVTHPHICTLHDVGDQDGVDFLVMEYLSGETLAHRLLRGALPLEEVLRIAAQIADALDAAHRQGLTHRDLKPANVMLTAGNAKVLDFGLAKWHAVESARSDPAAQPASHHTMTQVGAIVGTIDYLAPERVDGKPADARSDVFALGAIIYEMMTGRKPFEASGTSVMAAILSSTPMPMAAFRSDTPAALEHVVRRCLAKDPEQRWQSARDLAISLRWIAEAGGQAMPGPPARRTPRVREWVAWSLALAGCVAAVLAALAHGRTANAPPATPVRFEIPPPARSNGVDVPLISPDGQKIAFVASMAGGKSFLWVRSLSSLESKPIVETDANAFPFWSPDGRFLAFFADGKLRKIQADSGLVQVLCDAPAGRGGAWSRDGVILFAPATNTPLYRTSADGAPPVQSTTLAATPTERSHRFPHFLPDGRHFTYVTMGDRSGVDVGSLDAPGATRVVERSISETWAPRGYLFFNLDANLNVQRFDDAHLRVTDEAIPLTGRVAYGSVASNRGYSVSENGVLAYVTGVMPATQLTWLTRTGRALGSVGRPAAYLGFSIAPDGRRVAAARGHEIDSEIWVIDLAQGSESRLVPGQRRALYPVWSPDGNYVAYDATSLDMRLDHLFATLSNGTGTEQSFPVARALGNVTLDQWSVDGRSLLYELQEVSTGIHDLWVMPVTAGSTPTLFLRTNFNKTDAQFSPDGRWVAYGSDESGRSEVYVQSFPDGRGKWPVSTNGGRLPHWRRDGKELFYLAADETLSAVTIDPGGVFHAGTPKALFMSPNAGKRVETYYDVSADGDRFLFNVVVEGTINAPITVVLNWSAGLKK